MSRYHDPIRQLTTLSEVFAQDKRPLGLLLTAGCPFSMKTSATPDGLVPDIAGLTEAVRQCATNDDKLTKYETVRQVLVADGNPDPNIEAILGYVRSLREVVGVDSVRGLTASDVDDLELAISGHIAKIVDVKLPSPPTPYDDLALWVGSTSRSYPIELFTTNYDLLMEQALEARHVPYFDGFVGVCKAYFDQRAVEEDILPPRWARLWKLHGSVNWQLDERGGVVRLQDKTEGRSRLIHPSHLKYTESRRMPYLAMLDRLRLYFKQPSAVLLICGYSFRDQHLNEILLQGVQSNPTAAAFALQFDRLSSYRELTPLASSCLNFNALAVDEAIIGGERSIWKAKQSSDLAGSRVTEYWKSENGNQDDDLVSGDFMLGDFPKLGRFLASLASPEPFARA